MLDPEHEKRLRNLIGSWAIRAKPGAPGDQQSGLLRENIAAVENAIESAERAREREANVASAQAILRQVKREMRRRSRLGIPVGRGDLMAFTNRVAAALEKLEKQ